MTFLVSGRNHKEVNSKDKIFLGGCCINDFHSVTEDHYLNNSIAPTYVHSIDEQIKAESIIIKYYPLLIREISKTLNKYHKTSNSLRFWENI